MYDPTQILAWLDAHVNGMRRSRMKTLAAVTTSALCLRGCGVLALGRSMAGAVAAKHCIKRVWRFFRNPSFESEALAAGLLRALLPAAGRVTILVDWTTLGDFAQLVFALPRDGRALPFLCRTIRPKGDGSMRNAEEDALAVLARILPQGRQVILVADRGFGHSRWMSTVEKRGWAFVQRVAGYVGFDRGYGATLLRESGLVRGCPVRDLGPGLLSSENPFACRVVGKWGADHKEAWFLASNLTLPAAELVRIYERRMWIESCFRDLKSRKWGMGLEQTRLLEPQRHDVLFGVLSLAYAFLSAFGAAAETLGVDDAFKANTETTRAMNLARLGNYFLQIASCTIALAFEALRDLPP